jgi:thiosulfate/3-mercaptopyruvate sulfurtransferase
VLTATILSLVLLAGGDNKPASYVRPDLLIEPAALKDAAARKKFILLDARLEAEYRKGHVPGARAVNVSAWKAAFEKDEDRAAWVKRIGSLGIDTGTPVVIYGDRLPESARVWWLLCYWGIKDVRLLNGGWKGWRAAEGPLSTDVPVVKAASPDLKAQPERLATRDQLLEGLKKDTLGQVIDTRSTGEFTGQKKLAKRGGAIPQAKHLEWSDTIDQRTGRFKPPAELAKLFKDAGIDPAKPATTYCQSGGRASVMAFALELTSGKAARNYCRSWAEWGNDERTPIDKPK